MNRYELYDKYKKQYNFRDGDCCATCKYGDVYHEEEMHCNRLDHIEVIHFEICDLFEKGNFESEYATTVLISRSDK